MALKRGPAIGVLAVVVTGWAVVVFSERITGKPVAVGVDRCPVEASARGRSIAFVVDTTDERTPAGRQRVGAKLDAVMAGLQAHDRLTLFQISGEAAVTGQPWMIGGKPVSFCKGEDGKTASAVTQAPLLLARAFEREVRQPVLAALEKLSGEPAAQRSPIIEALTALMFTPEYRGPAKGLEIVIVSDLLQHSPALTQLKGKQPGACEMARSAVGRAFGERVLAGTMIDIVYERSARLASRQGAGHLKTWSQFFALNGIRHVVENGRQVPFDVKCTDARGGFEITKPLSWSTDTGMRADQPKEKRP